MTAPTEADRSFLARAVELGRRGWGRVAPNPMVGCLLVRDGEVVGEGWHAEYGGDHAEVAALRAAGELARGATAYVSLEPCRHEGKTPPCTRALLAAGVAKVIYGAADPGEESGGGGAELAAAGVEVVGPAFSRTEAARENPGFFHDRPDRPHLELKLAVSLDGKIARRAGERTQLSGPEAAAAVHRLRAGFDGILVGARTAAVDDPALTVRGEITPRVPPRRIVMDARGTTPTTGRLFSEPGGEAWLLTTEASPMPWREAVERAGGHLRVVEADSSGRVSLPGALAALRAAGVRTLLCEGGGVLGSALISAGAVDRLHLLVSSRFLGDEGVPAFTFPDPEGVPAFHFVAKEGVPAFTFPSGGAILERGGWVPLDAPRLSGADLWISLERATNG